MLTPVIRFVIWALATFMVVSIFAPSRETLLAGLASVGIALGLGAQDLVKNIIGGLVILVDRPYQLGDRVKIGDAYGEIDHIGLRSTKLTTPDDTRVTIPNSEILSGMAWNANSGVPDCQVVTDLFLPPDTDPAVAMSIGYDAAYTSPYLLLDKPVVVLLQDHFEQARTWCCASRRTCTTTASSRGCRATSRCAPRPSSCAAACSPAGDGRHSRRSFGRMRPPLLPARPRATRALLAPRRVTLPLLAALLFAGTALPLVAQAPAEHARTRWERLCQIRRDQFDLILPAAMRDHGVDMWIVMQKENQFDPMYDDLGRGYVGSVGYWIFTDAAVTASSAPPSASPATSSIAAATTSCAASLRSGRSSPSAIRSASAINMSETSAPPTGSPRRNHDRLLKELGPELRVARRLRRARGVGFPQQLHRVDGSWRSARPARSVAPPRRPGALQRGHHARRHHARGCAPGG